MNRLEKQLIKICRVKAESINFITFNLDELMEFINQNYISKEEILGLEELKEEKTTKKLDAVLRPRQYFENQESLNRNQLRKEIKEAINNLK